MPKLKGEFMKIALLGIFNILDAFFTLRWIRLGIATEGNPIMDFFLQIGEVYFCTAKIFIGLVACLTFYTTRNYIVSDRGSSLVAIIYGCLVVYHLTIALGLV